MTSVAAVRFLPIAQHSNYIAALGLVKATQNVIWRSLDLIGVEAPESM